MDPGAIAPGDPPRRTRLLLLITDLRLGGTPRMLETLALALDRDRFDVEVAVLMEGSSIRRSLEVQGIPVHVLGMRSKLDPSPLLRLFRLLRRGRYDLVHAWLFHANLVAKVLGRMAGVRRILTSERGVETNKSRLRVLVDRATRSLTDRLVVNARAIRDVQVERERMPASRIVVIPNGIGLDRFTPVAVEAPASTLVVTVARFDPVKGHRDLLRAAAEVLRLRPGTRFRWIGSGPELEPVRRDVAGFGLEAHIQIPGEVDDVRPHLHEAGLFVLASHQEGMPGSILEAMACGVPVVATAVGGVPELVIDRETGLLVPPRDPGALARAILELIDDPPRRAAMGQAARRQVEASFTRATFVTAHERLYDEVMGGPVG